MLLCHFYLKITCRWMKLITHWEVFTCNEILNHGSQDHKVMQLTNAGPYHCDILLIALTHRAWTNWVPMGPNCRLQDGEAQMVLICATEFSKIFNGSSSPLILITEGPNWIPPCPQVNMIKINPRMNPHTLIFLNVD